MGQLFTSASHEIKNQLAGIIGALRVLSRDVPDSDSKKPILGKILAEMEQMSQNAVAALDFARPLKSAATSVDVGELLDLTAFFVERQATVQEVKLEKHYAAELPRASVDGDLMKQVFLNILLNGVQASESISKIMASSPRRCWMVWSGLAVR